MPVAIPDGSDFTLANLPFGIGAVAGAAPRAYVAVGDRAIDIAALARTTDIGAPAEVFEQSTLNAFLALGPDTWRAVRAAVADNIDGGLLVRRDTLVMRLPIDVADYVDMYAGIHHATNLGRLFRPDGEPLLPNWRRLPVAYHGRAGTIVVSGSDVVRPYGQILVDDELQFGPTRQLDIELELGFVVGVGSEQGTSVPVAGFEDHVFGVVLVNDWSARDIQAFEYQPLGPFLGKSFATSMSAWIVPLDALAPFMVRGHAARQDPPPAEYLRDDRPHMPALQLEALLESATMRAQSIPPVPIGCVALEDALYWSMPQQLAHATVNGASLRTGDLFATGTLSGPDPATQAGSLIERTWRGTRPLTLPTGETRAFLEDGDRVTLRGWCGAGERRVGLGDLVGTIVGTRGGS